MVREPDATMQPTPQNNQLMSKHRVLSLKPQLRLEWRGQDGHNETEQPNHSASLGDSITSSTRMRFSVHTPLPDLPFEDHPSIRDISEALTELCHHLDESAVPYEWSTRGTLVFNQYQYMHRRNSSTIDR